MPKETDTRPFHLKQFSLYHHRSSMKVGTDSLLLGIWISTKNANRVLDIGTGCGILSLLMAARSNALIDAIELDKNSFEEAKQNFNKSPFSERLLPINQDFRIYAQQYDKKYDLIISNPPFFINDLRPIEKVRSNARHCDQLNYEELCAAVVKLLPTNGRFCLVLPYEESKVFISTAKKFNMRLSRQMLVFPKRGLQPNRVNLEFVTEKDTGFMNEKFIIREENNQFTEQYICNFKNYLIGLD